MAEISTGMHHVAIVEEHTLPYFLNQSQRFYAALNTFDPLSHDPLLAALDPVPRNRELTSEEGRLPLFRLALFFLFLCGPTVFFAACPSKLLGGTLAGSGHTHPMLRDFAIWGQYLLWAIWLVMIVWGRRLLGELLNHLVMSGIIQKAPDTTTLHWQCHSRLLRFFEWVTRLNSRRLIFWIPVLLFLNCLNQYQMLCDQTFHNWTSTLAEPHTLLYVFHVGDKQPHLAGMWHLCIASPFGGYLILIILRLFVMFACLLGAVARCRHLRITPSHPDGTGGIACVGQTALAFSTFIFSSGLWLTALSFQIAVNIHSATSLETAAAASAHHQIDLANATMFCLLWVIYLVFGPLMFFLPLLPLRGVMKTAKRQYLLQVESLYEDTDHQHRQHLASHQLNADTLQTQLNLAEVMVRAKGMAVWPFDRKTFLRFAGTLVSPLVPILIERAGLVGTLLTFFQLN